MGRFLLSACLLAFAPACNSFYDVDSAPLRGTDDGGDGAADGGDVSSSSGCIPETDEGLCAASGAQCGTYSGEDRCGTMREVSCGDCPPGWTCGLGGPNVCGCNCELDGACVSEGVRAPDGSCRVCGPEGWEISTDLDCSDGDLCTVDDTCQDDGTCTGTPLDCTPGECATGAQCDPATGECVLEPGLDGEPCTDDGLDCTDDICRDGTCAHPRIAQWCIVDGECVAQGSSTQDGECVLCDVQSDPFSWTTEEDGTPCAGGLGTCEAGACIQ